MTSLIPVANVQDDSMMAAELSPDKQIRCTFCQQDIQCLSIDEHWNARASHPQDTPDHLRYKVMVQDFSSQDVASGPAAQEADAEVQVDQTEFEEEKLEVQTEAQPAEVDEEVNANGSLWMSCNCVVDCNDILCPECGSSLIESQHHTHWSEQAQDACAGDWEDEDPGLPLPDIESIICDTDTFTTGAAIYNQTEDMLRTSRGENVELKLRLREHDELMKTTAERNTDLRKQLRACKQEVQQNADKNEIIQAMSAQLTIAENEKNQAEHNKQEEINILRQSGQSKDEEIATLQSLLEQTERQIAPYRKSVALDDLQNAFDTLSAHPAKLSRMNTIRLLNLRATMMSNIQKVEKAQKERRNADQECIVCFENQKNIIFADGCQHIVVCDRCEKILQPKRCPVCRIEYSIVKIYTAISAMKNEKVNSAASKRGDRWSWLSTYKKNKNTK